MNLIRSGALITKFFKKMRRLIEGGAYSKVVLIKGFTICAA